MPLNESRIYPVRPVWAGLPEISRDKDCVWFKKTGGRIRVSLADVERWAAKNK